MQWQVIQSTTLAAIAYEPNRQLLHLKFRDGAVYKYFQVPEPVFDALQRAPSKGEYFNGHIRGQFAHQRRASRRDKASYSLSDAIDV